MSMRCVVRAAALSAVAIVVAGEAHAQMRMPMGPNRGAIGAAVGIVVGTALSEGFNRPDYAPPRHCVPTGRRWTVVQDGRTIRRTRCADGRLMSETIDDRTGRVVSRTFTGRIHD